MKSPHKPGKKEFLASVVPAHTSALKRFALSLCKNAYDADDLVSETMLKAFENYEKLKDESKLKQWLFRIMNNHFINGYRNNKKFIDITFPDEELNEERSFSLFEEMSTSSFVTEGNPEKKFISKLTQADIQKSIDSLPEDFRMALVLCDMEEFSYAEIADIIKVPVGTVRSRIARARTILQKQLWMHAQELGIKKAKSTMVKSDYTCTCGKEETLQISEK